jgi:hypothetical protein
MCAGGGGWETEHHDFGASFSGTWAGVADFIDNGGGAVAYLDLSTVDSGYTAYSGLTAAVTARWAKMRVASSNPFIVTGLGLVRVTVVGRSESGSVTTSATVATTVSLANRYAKAVSIQLTAASGSTPRFPTYDNVVVGTGVTNSFDAYAFDAAGAKQATSCAWVFTGI